jgi:hypothetical protein
MRAADITDENGVIHGHTGKMLVDSPISHPFTVASYRGVLYQRRQSRPATPLALLARKIPRAIRSQIAREEPAVRFAETIVRIVPIMRLS